MNTKGKNPWLAFIIFTALVVCFLGISPAQQVQAQDPASVNFVTTGGEGDCTSWEDACDLQTALAAAGSGSEIWAAAGTYKPTTDPANRAATFQLKADVAVYGGFAGTEASREARDPAANLTVLSGDLNGDDEPDFTNNGENSYHVVTGANGAILDGVTITAGNANGFTEDGTQSNGGGMYNDSASPTLNDVTISGNSAWYDGGGMYNSSASPALTNVTFSGNSAYYGGGMYNAASSGTTLSKVTFIGNSALYGGGMYNEYASPTLSNVIFSGNTAAFYGGGMCNFGSPTLTNVTFSDNSANAGGGMYNAASSGTTLTNVTFSSNTARIGSGGGMFNAASSPALSNVTFIGNSAGNGGGMYNVSGSNPTLTGVTFSGNSAEYNGGGMYNYSSSGTTLSKVTFIGNSAAFGGGMYNRSASPTLTNVTFSDNSAANGGGMYNVYSSAPVIQNTILWGDSSGEVVNVDSSTATITSSVVQGGCPAGATCTNLITADPRLGALGNYGGDALTLPLLPGSSAIDAGDDSLCPATDQRGITRVGTCDIGAFEYDYTGIYYVTPGGSGTQDGQSWANASDLQNTLKTARSGSEIWAAAGTYKPTADPANRAATFQLKAGVAVYGGFAGTEASREARDPAANLTVLSGDLNGDDGPDFTNNGENSYHVVTGANGAILDGVTITAGNANRFTEDGTQRIGGGMYNDSASPTLNDVIFSGNSAWNAGGGMYNSSASPALSNVTFSGNTANAGGGMYNVSYSNPTLTGVTFSGNSARFGGGMYNLGSSPTLTNVTFSGNSAAFDGGGMYGNSASPALTNVTFSGNSARFGGGMYNLGSSPTLAKVTFSDNVATGIGGGMANGTNSNPALTNVTFSSNSAEYDGGGMSNTYSSPTLTNVTFSDNSAANGGGMSNGYSSPALTNVTFSSNSAEYDGGGMWNRGSSPTLTNVTFSSNSAASGSGMYNGFSSSPVIRNTILWGDSGGEVVYNDGSTATTITTSVVQGGCPAGATCTNLITTDPRLGVLGNYGGDTLTLPLLPGSSAIDTGDDSLCPAADQRGITRVGTCDIGAFESQGFTLGNLTGTPQSAVINTAFADPLGLVVTANNSVEPVDGGLVTFSAPGTGASTTLTGSPATISGGTVSVTATANNIFGSYDITASASGATSVVFALTNDQLAAITEQPQSQTVSVGDAVSFSSAASGWPVPTVQWQVSADDGETWSDIDGATASPLEFTAAYTQNDTQYRALFTNSAGGVASDAATLTVNKLQTTVSLSDLSPTYDGQPKPVTATTDPAGLTVNVTYDGSATVPTEAGEYAVTATISNSTYQGTASGTLVVGKANATVTLSNLEQTYDGTAKAATASTTPAGLIVSITYDGSATPPTHAGSYAVVATINDTNYQGSASGTLVIGKAEATVTLSNLEQTYDGSQKMETVTTNPAGLTVDVTYNGSATPPTNAGSYAVVATVNDANYQGSASGTLVIGKAEATVTLSNLEQTYDGSPKPVTVTTDPAGLSISITYDGSATAPMDAGEYAVIATVNSSTYQGSASGTLVIGKRAISVQADAQEKVFGESDPELTYQITSGSLVGSDSFSGALSRAAGEMVGTYAIQQDTLALSGNYDLSFTGNSLTINKKPASVTPAAASKTYGDVDPALTGELGGFVEADGVTAAYSRTEGEIAGSAYTISALLSPEDVLSNYNITYNTAAFTIDLRPIEVTADSMTKFVGQADPKMTYQITSGSLAFSDAFSGELTRSSGETAGTYTILQGTLVLNSNYNITYNAGTLTIVEVPAPILTGISPASTLAAGSSDVILTVTGSDFIVGSTVRWNGAYLATTYLSDTQLTAIVPAGRLASVQTAQVTVFTPAPGGGTSSVLAFFVTQAAAGVTGQEVASGTDPSASNGPAEATASGEGLLVVAQYDANPGGTPSFTANGTYFDVYTAPDNTFSQVSIVACGLNPNDKLFWWDTGQAKWQKASPQTYDSGCVTLIVTDSSSPSLSQLQGTTFAAGNTAPVANPGGPYLGAINTAIPFDGSASSDPENDPLSYTWDFGDGSTGNGATPTLTYTAPAIYDLCLTVKDGSLDSDPVCTIVVVYDPDGGFVTGGGWILSPAGAYKLDESLSGKATFGFVSKYKKGASLPEGNTEFQFQTAGFNFHSESYEWLVVNQNGANAQFKGSGTVNGALDQNGNAYKFMLWAGDGSPDTFRIKIWWEANGVETVVYDNGFEGSEYETGQPISGGSIIVHKSK